MNQKDVILHTKYSLEDGHVTPQIRDVPGYRGVFVTTSSKQYRESSPFADVIPLKELKKKPKWLREHRVKGVHIHHATLASKFHFLKEQHAIPLFAGFRGNDITAYPHRDEKYRENLLKLFTIGDRFFSVCEHLKRQAVKLGCPEEKIRVLYGGVDLSRFQYQPRVLKPGKSLRFLAVGRFVEKKGFADLIRAFARVKKQQKQAKLVLIGQGPCEKEYRKLIRKLDLDHDVRLLPWTDYRGIHERYMKSHIFCAPSCTDETGNQEGIPNTLKEAMATGMPVVATSHAGIPELVEHGVSGLLVPEKSVQELADAMNFLAEHPQHWESLGSSARKKIDRDFNLKKQLKKQKQFYDEVIRS